MRRLHLRRVRVLRRAGAAALVVFVAATGLGSAEPSVAVEAAAAAVSQSSTSAAKAAGQAQWALNAPAQADRSGVPEGVEVLFHEDFQNRSAGSLKLLTDYTGAEGQLYEADPYWSNINRCNGFVLDVETPYVRGACRSVRNVFNDLLLLVQTLGEYANPDDAAAAHDNAALAAMTQRDTTPQRLMLRTKNPVSIGEAGRFVTMSVDAAAMNCDQRKPKLQFSMISGGITTPLSPNLMLTCELPNERTFVVGKNAKPVRYGTLVSDGAILLSGASFGIQLENHETSGAGNDGAIDNMRVLDVTPHLAKSFAPSSVHVGERSKLSYTIANTSELNAKNGWSFADTLPEGLVVAAHPNAPVTSCAAAQVAAAPGGAAITVTGGNLGAGEASCSVTIDVTSESPRGSAPSPKRYTSDATTVTAPIGVQPMGEAAVEFFSTPLLTVNKTSNAKASTQLGDKVTYQVTAKNTGTGDFREGDGPHLIDDLAEVLDDAELDEASIAVTKPALRASFDAAQRRIRVAGPLPVGESFTLRYTVKLIATTGDHLLKNTAFQSGKEGTDGAPPECEPDEVPMQGIACTSHPLPYLTVTKRSDAHTLPAPGDIVTYTVTAKNTGKAAFVQAAPAIFTDDLTDVLDDASYQHDATVSRNSVALDYTEPRLSWRGPLRAGQSVTLKYSVKLGGAGDTRVKNTAFVGSGKTPQCDAVAAETGTCAMHDFAMVHPALAWQKVSAAAQNSGGVLLGGSAWRLTPLDAEGVDQADQEITVTDTVANGAGGDASNDSSHAAAGRDRDPAKGKVRLEALAPGEYRLYETRAPVGYQLMSEPIRVTIPRQDVTVDLGPIPNTQQEVPAVPLTGGVGEYAFWAATGVAAVIAAAGIGARLRQRQRTPLPERAHRH